MIKPLQLHIAMYIPDIARSMLTLGEVGSVPSLLRPPQPYVPARVAVNNGMINGEGMLFL